MTLGIAGGSLSDETLPLKQRALLLANRIQPFYNEQAESGRTLVMIAPPQTTEDAKKNANTEKDFHDKVVRLFQEKFGIELHHTISEMAKAGLDVTDIKRKADSPDYWTIPNIIADLRGLASQIDDQGKLLR
jgi:hypothetical protein